MAKRNRNYICLYLHNLHTYYLVKSALNSAFTIKYIHNLSSNHVHKDKIINHNTKPKDKENLSKGCISCGLILSVPTVCCEGDNTSSFLCTTITVIYNGTTVGITLLRQKGVGMSKQEFYVWPFYHKHFRVPPFQHMLILKLDLQDNEREIFRLGNINNFL